MGALNDASEIGRGDEDTGLVAEDSPFFGDIGDAVERQGDLRLGGRALLTRQHRPQADRSAGAQRRAESDQPPGEAARRPGATRGAGRPLFLEISRFVVIGGHLDARQRGFIAVMPGEDGADAIGQARFARLDDVHPAACPLLPPGRIGIGISRLSRCSLMKRHGPVRPMPDPKSIRGFGFLKTA